jgi:hypothetical protein
MSLLKKYSSYLFNIGIILFLNMEVQPTLEEEIQKCDEKLKDA